MFTLIIKQVVPSARLTCKCCLPFSSAPTYVSLTQTHQSLFSVGRQEDGLSKKVNILN